MGEHDALGESVTINGVASHVASGTTVAELIAQRELRPEHVAVEVNGRLVPKTRRAEQVLTTGDAVEIVTLVGGG